jgi:lipopolysaccharide/colanic/teichoic acid biosynthesis glycosyltransferase
VQRQPGSAQKRDDARDRETPRQRSARAIRLPRRAAPPVHYDAPPSRAARRPVGRWLPGLDAAGAAAAALVVLGDPLAAALAAVLAIPLVGIAVGYDEAPLVGRAQSWFRLAIAAIVIDYAAQLVSNERSATSSLFLLGATLSAWTLVRTALRHAQRRRPERVVILGSGQVATRLAQLVSSNGRGQLEVVGCLDDTLGGGEELRQIGRLSRLRELAAAGSVDRVMVAFPAGPDRETFAELRYLDALGTRIDVVPRMFELLGDRVSAYRFGTLSMTMVRARAPDAQRWIKRAFDIGASTVLLVAVAPLMAMIALAIKADDRGSILSRQRCVGYRGRAFQVLKFRTTVLQAASSGATASEAVETRPELRPTRVGAFISGLSLDKLPQLWNVLRGDIGLVGPRPLHTFELAALESWGLTCRLERPGITRLDQGGIPSAAEGDPAWSAGSGL